MSNDTTTPAQKDETAKSRGSKKDSSKKDGPKKDGDATKNSFWSLSRGKSKDDATDHPAFQPTLPQVNLLPAAIKDAITAGKMRRWFIVGAVVLAAVVAGVWLLQTTKITTAQDTLVQAQAENAQLKASMGELTGVKEMYGQITRLQDLVTTTMASQPQSAVVLQQFAAAGVAAAGGAKPITFDTIEVAYTGIPRDPTLLNPCPNPDPFAKEATIGCVTFSGTAVERQQVSDLLRALQADPLFIGPFVPTISMVPGDKSAGTTDSVAFSGSTGVSLEALETKLTPEQIDAIINPPQPSASPSPSPSGAAS